jgi:hypothetical protein
MKKKVRFFGLTIFAALLGAALLMGIVFPAAATAATPKILFESDRDGDGEIYMMNIDGTDVVQLTDNTALDYGGSVAPDGDKVVFVSDRSGNREIHAMDIDGTNVVQLTNDTAFESLSPDWSPDGTRIAFWRRNSTPFAAELYIVDADGSNLVRMTSNSKDDNYPFWSPDGSRVGFARSPEYTWSSNIFIMNADGTNEVRLTSNTSYRSALHGDWSPDGSQIVFVEYPNSGTSEIYVMNADGSGKVNLTSDGYNDYSPCWSPDGSQIVFASYRDGDYEIIRMDSDGSNVVQLTDNSFSEGSPDWFMLDTSVDVSIPDLTATYLEALDIPVHVGDVSGEEIVSAEIFVAYDGDLLVPAASPVTLAGMTSDWSLEYNIEQGDGTPIDILKIAMADEVALPGAGDIAILHFAVVDQRSPASSALELTHVLFNDGTPEAVAGDGSVTLVGNTGTIETDVDEIIPREPITVTVTDADADVTGGVDQISVEVVNLDNGDTVSLTIDETDVASGQFVETVDTEFGTEDIIDDVIQAQADDVIEFRFVDELDDEGNGPETLVASVTAKGQTDGTIAVSVVTQPGDLLYIEVTDPDLNTTGGEDEVMVEVTTDGGDSESVTLTEADAEDEVFFGQIATTPSAGVAGELTAAKGVIVTVTYDDVVTASGDQVDRVATSDVVDPFGDVDGNGLIQAYDASLVLQSLLTNPPVVLTGLDLLAADVADDFGDIIPLDVAHILKKVVGLLSVFDVQKASSLNHPQGVASPKWAVEERMLALRVREGYVSVWAEDLSEIVSGEVVLEGVSGSVELGEELTDFLLASGSREGVTQVLFAGAESVSGPGELLRIYTGVGPGRVRLTRAMFNDGSLVGRAGEVRAVPSGLVLYPNVPNPFNPETVIRYGLPVESAVVVEVFDVVGQRVKVLVSGVRSSGDHEVVWDGRDETGGSVSSGVYFYRMRAGDEFTRMRRMLLLK